MTPQDLSQIKKLLEENNKNLVTKKDLIENNKLFMEYFASKHDLEKFVTNDEYHRTVDQILTSMDNIYGIVKRWDEERLLFSTKIQNHDTRLSKIENNLFAN